MKQPSLFEIERIERIGPSAQSLLNAFKKRHGILTHRCNEFANDKEFLPWVALLPWDEDKGKTIDAIYADKGRLYDESERTAEGRGELTVVRELCRKNGILCEL